MRFLFTRWFYFAFGAAGLVMDYIAHFLQVTDRLADPVVATLKLVIGWQDVYLASGQWLAFSFGVVAHSMFLVAFILLALRAD